MKLAFVTDSVKILIFAATVIITCILVALGFQAASVARGIGNNAILQMAEINNDLQSSDIKRYDQAEIYGSDVVNCIKKHLGDYQSTDIAPIYIGVITSLSEQTYTNGGYIKDIKNFTNTRYVKPTAVFIGSVVKNENNVILGITFVQK